MNAFKHSSPFSPEESSPLAILTSTSAPVTIFLAVPWKGLTYVFRFFKSDCICSLHRGTCVFVFLYKWLLCVLMQFPISFYSLILFGVQLKWGNWEQNHSLHQNWYYIFLSLVLRVFLLPCWLWPLLLNLMVSWKTLCHLN